MTSVTSHAPLDDRLPRRFPWIPVLARAAGAGLTGTVACLVLVVAAGALGAAFGFHVLVVRSGSMRPTLGVGDVVVVESVPPARIRAGEIVTFSDHTRAGALVTHRVVKIADPCPRRPGQPRGTARGGADVCFVTKGDANHAPERWSVPATGTVGRYAASVPGLGRLLAYLGGREVRVALVILLMAALLVGGLRRIWRDPAPPATAAP